MSVRAKQLIFEADATWEGLVSWDDDVPVVQTGPGLTPEHLMMGAVARCTLASLRHSAGRAGVEADGTAHAHGVVSARPEDGIFAFVEVTVDLDVTMSPDPGPDGVRDLIARAERGCFAGQSLRAKPVYRWRVNGAEVPAA